MAQPMSKLKHWRLAIWKACSGSLLIIGVTCPSTILNWDSMTARGRSVALIGIAVAVIKFLDAFIDQTCARLAQGKPPYGPPSEMSLPPEQPTPPASAGNRVLQRLLARPFHTALNAVALLLVVIGIGCFFLL